MPSSDCPRPARGHWGPEAAGSGRALTPNNYILNYLEGPGDLVMEKKMETTVVFRVYSI